MGTELWLADWRNADDTVGGHTLVTSEQEARALADEWRAEHPELVTLVSRVRLCTEDDPELERYDNDYESYFALVGKPT